MALKCFFMFLVCIAIVLAYQEPKTSNDILTKTSERRNNNVACNPNSTPRFSCYSCYTVLECKENGGKVRQCKDPYAPYCNGGMCSAEPGELCEKPEEENVNEENGENGDVNGESGDVNEESGDENEESGDENNDDATNNEVEEQDPEHSGDASNDVNIGDEAQNENEESDAGDDDDVVNSNGDENKIVIAPEFRNAVAESHPPNHHDEEISEKSNNFARIEDDFIYIRQSRFLPCNYIAMPTYSCYDCNVRVICKHPVGGKLVYCPEAMPYCNNGFCGVEPSKECA